ncbi:hypothetical protein G6F70_008620 [Rhizopus microsporus]|nr:hypothetical protein G6F71_008595 [Rhizopus microsporus]KAG1194941.1 hypothetical protein G6F70_008620 [Rhizopus microsporus]KAG1211154.1 hypothetical protein G6F69_004848 [Rhizopus microsporus]KAG1227316.1 hypothetical protein G6F67_008526 [Rhizopus microsporus]KAG1259193.1 hypothetical protein G6F68_008287 [Rhizopus microsporus]
MGKKVTYAIGFIRQSPFAQELKEQQSRYDTELELGNKRKAATIALEISDLLIAQVDEIDPGLPVHVQEQDRRKFLTKAIGYCKEAIKIFQRDKHSPDTMYDLVSAYYNLCQCHSSLEDYEAAIRYGTIALSYMPREDQDKSKLQMIYKTIGDTYFIKATDPDESRHDDFFHAYEYYMKEKSILETMTLDDVDRDPTVLPQFHRSNKFNLGVVCSKLPNKREFAEKFLKDAVEDAQTLKDYANEKKTWWELGNHYRRVNQDHLVKACQIREMNIIRQHGFHEDELPCLEERIKFHLEMKEFVECYRLSKRLKELTNEDTKEYYTSIYSLITQTEQLMGRYEEQDNIHSCTPETLFYKVSLIYELAQLLMENQMHRAAFRIADQALRDIDAFKSSTGQMISTYLNLLQIKAESQWQLRESNIEDYIDLDNQTLEFIDKHTRYTRIQLEHKIDVYKRRIEIHTYYNQTQRVNHFKKLLKDTEARLEVLPDIIQDDPMDVDEQVSITPLRFGNRITPSHKLLLKSDTINIRINVLFPEPVLVRILCYDLKQTVKWLMEEIRRRTWQIHGIEPIISRLKIKDSDLYPNDLIQDVFLELDQQVDAVVTGTALKSALDIYLNACDRLDIRPSEYIRKQLADVSHGIIPLKGAVYEDQIPAIEQVLQKMNMISTLDLSFNFLNDNTIERLLKYSKAPNEINLSNNRATLSTLQLLTDLFSNSDLARLSLAYNSLGPELINKVPELITAFPNLRVLNLEGTFIGKYMAVNDDVRDLYRNMAQAEVPYRITINLSNNHFEKDMLSIWTSLLVRIERLDKLQLSGITSDTAWSNFVTLSDSSLRGIDYNHSAKDVLDLMDLNFLLGSGKMLTELDLSGCGLTHQDIIKLCQGIQYQSNMKILSFRSNPAIGDESINSLYQLFKQCKIGLLDFSYCGLTFAGASTIALWAANGLVKEIDMTGNIIFDTTYQLDRFMEIYGKSDTKIIIDSIEASRS